MMFVSGEMAEPPIEVLKVMEEIVRDQIVEMVNFHMTRNTATTNSNTLVSHSQWPSLAPSLSVYYKQRYNIPIPP